jgi:protein-S-isoprenylcysteine O-methyltransferase Ste14
MQLFPEYSFRLLNIWWYPLFYGIISILVMSKISKDKKKRILTFPKYKSVKEKFASGFVTFVFGKGLIIYSFFVPLNLFTFNFYVGTIIYLVGLFSSVYAMWTFSEAELSEPVTNGIFKISRHPMQVMNFIMWIGIGIVSGTWIVIICAVLFAILSYPSLKSQEKYCIDKYGDKYNKYMKETPRWILFK